VVGDFAPKREGISTWSWAEFQYRRMSLKLPFNNRVPNKGLRDERLEVLLYV
jgi:hypothetical protein